MYISILIAGFGGGFVRGLIGYLKYQYSYKNVPFNLPYFFVMMFLSGIIGILVASAVDNSSLIIEGVKYISPGLAFIIGYAGGDFLDGVWKIIISKVKIKK
jgi:uncharacterized membrane protein YjjP (DUF1212 family)